jgi:monofunctional biosynthetic peptidoglycan transglycosylase
MSIRSAYAAPDYPSRGGQHKRKHPLRRLFFACLAVTVAFPLALITLFRFVPPPATPLMLFTKGPIVHSWMPLESISPNLVQAVIASEDSLFCSHNGFDWDAIDKALDSNAAGGKASRRQHHQPAGGEEPVPAARPYLDAQDRRGLSTVLLAPCGQAAHFRNLSQCRRMGTGPHRRRSGRARQFRQSRRQLSPIEAARLATIPSQPARLSCRARSP